MSMRPITSISWERVQIKGSICFSLQLQGEQGAGTDLTLKSLLVCVLFLFFFSYLMSNTNRFWCVLHNLRRFEVKKERKKKKNPQRSWKGRKFRSETGKKRFILLWLQVMTVGRSLPAACFVSILLHSGAVVWGAALKSCCFGLFVWLPWHLRSEAERERERERLFDRWIFL